MGALFALNMLVGTPAGSSYSEPEYTEWLTLPGSRKLAASASPACRPQSADRSDPCAPSNAFCRSKR